MTDNAPGWQPDPTGRFEHRYWDGSQWTDNVANAGVASNDPYDTSAAAGLDETAAVETPADAGAGDPTVVGASTDASGTGWAAPTAAQPATPADQTAAWPTSPPPPSFPPAGGPPPVASSGGSKRGLLIGGGILAVVVLAIGAFLLLGGDDENDEVRTDLIAGLRDEGLSGGDAECLADAIIDEVGTDELEGEDFSSQPDAVSDELLADSLERCDIDEQALGGGEDDDDSTSNTDDDGDEPDAYGDDPELDALYDDCEDGDMAACDTLFFDSPIGSEYEAFAESCGGTTDAAGGLCDSGDGEDGADDTLLPEDMPEDFDEMLTDAYEGMGIPRDKAECLANRISDAVNSGDLSQEDAFSDFFGFFEDCDIDPSEITGG